MNSKQKIISILITCLILLGSFNVRVFAEPPAAPAPTTQPNLEDTADETGSLWSNLFGAGVGVVAGGMATVTILPAILALTVIAQPIVGFLVMLVGGLTNLALRLNFGLLNKENSFIELGWTICRDLTNLGFVLFIIVIAIGNILRVKQYQIKNVLWKLIVVAVLVNFSLLFTGVFVDFSNMLTNFFMQKANNGNLAGLGTSLMIRLGASDFQNIKDSSGFLESLGSGFALVLNVVCGAVFSLLFTVLAGLCLLAFAVMFFIRFIYLSALLILLPLACLSWILPTTESLWKKWWSQFFRWVAFAPFASFFIYLSFALVEHYNTTISPLVTDIVQGGSSATEAMTFAHMPISNFFATVSRFVVILGFLIGGLYAADKMGIHTASTFVGWAEGGTKGVGKWFSRAPLRSGSWLLRRGNFGQKMGGSLERIGNRLQQQKGTWGWLARSTGVAGGFTGIGGGLQRGTTYKSPNLFQSVIHGITKQKGKEPESRVQRIRREIDTNNKQRGSLINAMQNLPYLTTTNAQGNQVQLTKDQMDEIQKGVRMDQNQNRTDHLNLNNILQGIPGLNLTPEQRAQIGRIANEVGRLDQESQRLTNRL